MLGTRIGRTCPICAASPSGRPVPDRRAGAAGPPAERCSTPTRWSRPGPREGTVRGRRCGTASHGGLAHPARPSPISPRSPGRRVSPGRGAGRGLPELGGHLADESIYAVLPLVGRRPRSWSARNVGHPSESRADGGLEARPGRLEPVERFVAAWDWRSERRGRRAGRAAVRRAAALADGRGPRGDLAAAPTPTQPSWSPPEVEVTEARRSDRRVGHAEPRPPPGGVAARRAGRRARSGWVRSVPDLPGGPAERLLARRPDRPVWSACPTWPPRWWFSGPPEPRDSGGLGEASEALDLFTARMADVRPVTGGTAWAAIFLAGSTTALGEPDLLTEAVRRLAAGRPQRPGSGSRPPCVSEWPPMLADRPPIQVPTEPATEPLEPGSSLQGVAAALEWCLATSRPGAPTRTRPWPRCSTGWAWSWRPGCRAGPPPTSPPLISAIAWRC